ncbi:MAG: hypothetical protein JO025_09110 [Verrucomicrobia bacterium]|nr:hypothetical protein [Verrucomicrobiota bacterium]
MKYPGSRRGVVLVFASATSLPLYRGVGWPQDLMALLFVGYGIAGQPVESAFDEAAAIMQ